MRFLIRLAPTHAPREAALSRIRAIARSSGVDLRSPKWTSKGALEIDVFTPARSDFQLFLAAASPLFRLEFSKDLNVAPPHSSDEALLAEARGYFNDERYWECHEVLEGLWRQRTGDEKRLLQGMILVCAAFVHHQKGEDNVGFGILRRALVLLSYTGDEYGGFRADKMKKKASQIIAQKTFSTFTV